MITLVVLVPAMRSVQQKFQATSRCYKDSVRVFTTVKLLLAQAHMLVFKSVVAFTRIEGVDLVGRFIKECCASFGSELHPFQPTPPTVGLHSANLLMHMFDHERIIFTTANHES